MLEQKVDFQITSEDLKETLDQLSKSTGIQLAYSSSFFKKTSLIKRSFQQQSLSEILEYLLDGQDLDYKLNGTKIFIVKIPRYTISGFLEDNKTGERLIAANIFCSKLDLGTTTNEYGFFSLSLPRGLHTIDFSYLGYEIKKQEIDLIQNLRILPKLSRGHDLPEIIVSSSTIANNLSEEFAESYIDEEKIQRLPGIGGELDPIRAAQLLPGVQGTVDGLGGLVVRGGDPGQNLLLMDGVSVYIPYHLLGLYSVYNPSTIKSTKVLRGFFPARFGGRVSSVFDIRTKDGNKYNYSGEANANLSSSSLMLEGPIKKGKSSFMLAGRNGHPNLLLEPSLESLYFQDNSGNLETSFYDYNLKLNFDLGINDRIYFSWFEGADEFSKSFTDDSEDELIEESEFNFEWKNQIGSLRWNHVFNDKIFANTTLRYSFFNFINSNFSYSDFTQMDSEDELIFVNSTSNNRDLGLSYDVTWLPNPQHIIRMGLGISDKHFIPDLTYYDQDDEELIGLEELNIANLEGLVSSQERETAELFVYAEDDFRIGERIHLNAGLRATAFFGEDQTFFAAEPRIALHYHAKENFNIKITAGQTRQFLHLIRVGALSLPTDLWTPSSSELDPISSWQYEAGFDISSEIGLSWELIGFAKFMSNLYAYPDNSEYLEFLEEEEFTSFLTEGQGQVFGIESTLEYKSNDWGASLALGINEANRTFADQNLGLTYPYEFDQRYQCKAFVYKKFGAHWSTGISWWYNSPNPKFQFGILEKNPVNPTALNPEGEKNESRGIPYHRLDIDIKYEIQKNKWQHQFSLGAYNLYNQRNAAYYEITPQNGQFETSPIYSIPFLPTLSYKLKFN